jgi:hypothetical protein
MLALGAARAEAATYCVGVSAAGCSARTTARAAFAAAAASAGRDTILLGRLDESGAFGDDGDPLDVIGAGADQTVLRGSGGPALQFTATGSSARLLNLRGDVRLLDESRMQSAVVAGRMTVSGGAARLESVSVAAPGPAVTVGCGGSLVARHATVDSSGDAGVALTCSSARADVRNSIVWGADSGFSVADGAAVATAWSAFPGAAAPANVPVADPGFVAANDLRLRADSPLVDVGDPAPLADAEWPDDALGDVRAVAARSAVARRDVGAYEYQPPPAARPHGNLLANPGAEQATPAGENPAPPRWTRTGPLTVVRYGTFPFPSARAGDALGAGRAFFAGGPAAEASATQIADVSLAAPEIDLGGASVALSALLGGYRADADSAVVEAAFRDPSGAALGRARLGPVTAPERAHATTLMPRALEVPVPPLTRTVAVTLRATRAGGTYDDAYFDDVALAPRIPGLPPGDLPAAPAQPARGYSGAIVVSPRVGVDRKRRAWVSLACPSATVGRCHGVVTLAAAARRRAHPLRVGAKRFGLRHGRRARVSIPLSRLTVRKLRARRRLHGRVYAATRDGQGVTRTTVAPVRVVR